MSKADGSVPAVSSTQQTIDTGDTVRHRPSGETWTVACVEGLRLSWCGWPEGTAQLADCELIEKAPPEARRKLLEEWAKPISHDRRNDHRHRYAVRQLEKEANPSTHVAAGVTGHD